MEGDGELTFGTLPQSLQGKSRVGLAENPCPVLCPELGHGWGARGGAQGDRGNAPVQVAELSSGSSHGSGVMGRVGVQAVPVSVPQLMDGGVRAMVALTPDS